MTRLFLLLVVLLGSACVRRNTAGPKLPEPWTRLHKDCSDDSDCDAGQQCLEWTGLLGVQHTCEIECSIENQWSTGPKLPPCPEPLTCPVILDGPTACMHPLDLVRPEDDRK